MNLSALLLCSAASAFSPVSRSPSGAGTVLVSQTPSGTAVLGAGGLSVRSGRSRLGLHFARWGRPGDLEPVPELSPDERAEKDQGGIVEWWREHGDHWEQGWTVYRRPAGSGPLELEVQLTGAASWEVAPGGTDAWIEGVYGETWEYGDVRAWDADGEPLDALLERFDEGLRLVVDDRAARYPVEIDPVLSAPTTLEEYNFDYASALSGAGDVNGDGYDDVIVGNWEDCTADIFHGSASGVSTTPAATVGGYWPFGYAVDGAGDVNGDGYDDVIVGSYYGYWEMGIIYVFYGSSSGISSSDYDWTYGGWQSYFGEVVEGAGDVDGDGYDDLLVGACTDRDSYIFYGSASGFVDDPIVVGDDTCTVAGAGDVNGDGYADVLAGEPGRARVFYGSSSGLGTSPDTTDGYTGNSLSAAGDINADGYDDFVVRTSGTAYAFLGGASGIEDTPVADLGSSSGNLHTVSGAGDVDGDGYDDVIVGDGDNDEFRIYHGRYTGLGGRGQTITGTGSFGSAVDAAGDVNGDGYDDVIVGADYLNGGDSGAAYVYYGVAGSGDTGVIDTGDTQEPEDTGDTQEPEDTGDTQEPEDTGDTQEPEDTGDTQEPEDTDDTQVPEDTDDGAGHDTGVESGKDGGCSHVPASTFPLTGLVLAALLGGGRRRRRIR